MFGWRFFLFMLKKGTVLALTANRSLAAWTVWPSGLRRWLQAPVRKGVGSNPTAVMPIAALDCGMSWKAWGEALEESSIGGVLSLYMMD